MYICNFIVEQSFSPYRVYEFSGMHIDINLPASSQSGRQGGCGGVAQSTADGNRNGNGNVNILATTRGIGLPRPYSPSLPPHLSHAAQPSLLLQLDNSIFVYLWLLLCNSFYSFCSFTFPISHFPFPISQANVVRGNKNKSKCPGDIRLQGDRLSDRWTATERQRYVYIETERINAVFH